MQCSEGEEKKSPLNQKVASLYYSAQKQYSHQQYIQTITLIDSALQIENDRARLHFLKGLSLLNIHQFEPAIQEFRKTLEINPEFPSALFQLGHVHSLQEQYDQALDNYRTALERVRAGNHVERNVQEKSILLQIGRTYNQLAQLDSAEAYFQQAINRDSSFAPALGEMGQIFKKSGDFQKALQYYERAMNLDPQNLEYQFNYAHLLFQIGKIEQAITHLREIVQ